MAEEYGYPINQPGADDPEAMQVRALERDAEMSRIRSQNESLAETARTKSLNDMLNQAINERQVADPDFQQRRSATAKALNDAIQERAQASYDDNARQFAAVTDPETAGHYSPISPEHNVLKRAAALTLHKSKPDEMLDPGPWRVQPQQEELDLYRLLQKNFGDDFRQWENLGRESQQKNMEGLDAPMLVSSDPTVDRYFELRNQRLNSERNNAAKFLRLSEYQAPDVAAKNILGIPGTGVVSEMAAAGVRKGIQASIKVPLTSSEMFWTLMANLPGRSAEEDAVYPLILRDIRRKIEGVEDTMPLGREHFGTKLAEMAGGMLPMIVQPQYVIGVEAFHNTRKQIYDMAIADGRSEAEAAKLGDGWGLANAVFNVAALGNMNPAQQLRRASLATPPLLKRMGNMALNGAGFGMGIQALGEIPGYASGLQEFTPEARNQTIGNIIRAGVVMGIVSGGFAIPEMVSRVLKYKELKSAYVQNEALKNYYEKSQASVQAMPEEYRGLMSKVANYYAEVRATFKDIPAEQRAAYERVGNWLEAVQGGDSFSEAASKAKVSEGDMTLAQQVSNRIREIGNCLNVSEKDIHQVGELWRGIRAAAAPPPITSKKVESKVQGKVIEPDNTEPFVPGTGTINPYKPPRGQQTVPADTLDVPVVRGTGRINPYEPPPGQQIYSPDVPVIPGKSITSVQPVAPPTPPETPAGPVELDGDIVRNWSARKSMPAYANLSEEARAKLDEAEQMHKELGYDPDEAVKVLNELFPDQFVKPSPREKPTEGNVRWTAAPSEETPSAPVVRKPHTDNPREGVFNLADRVKTWLDGNEPMDGKQLFGLAQNAFGGSMAGGKYSPQDAYEGLELAVNKIVVDKGYNGNNPAAAVYELEKLTDRLPTQTSRDADKIRFQQFSTPPAYAYVVNWVANIGPSDVVLEPSAGVGGIASHAFAYNPRAVVANEIDAARAKLLSDLPVNAILHEDAEHIDIFARARGLQPTVVVMNPPFSHAGHRLGDKMDLSIGGKHILAALKSLPPNGRLVAIVGRGMAMDAPKAKPFWALIRGSNRVLANVLVSGDIYKKYGTSFDSRLLVIDKGKLGPGSNVQEIVTGEASNLIELIDLLRGVRDERLSQSPSVQPTSIQPSGPGAPQSGGRGGQREATVSGPTGSVGPGAAGPADQPTGNVQGPGAEGHGPATDGLIRGDGVPGAGTGGGGSGGDVGSPGDTRGRSADLAGDSHRTGEPSVNPWELTPEEFVAQELAKESQRGKDLEAGGSSDIHGAEMPGVPQPPDPKRVAELLEKHRQFVMSTMFRGEYVPNKTRAAYKLPLLKDDRPPTPKPPAPPTPTPPAPPKAPTPPTSKPPAPPTPPAPTPAPTPSGPAPEAVPGKVHKEEIVDRVYEDYVAPELPLPPEGYQFPPHPSKLVESAAMAGVQSPKMTYQPMLTAKQIKDSNMSVAQWHSVVLAGYNHEQMLPNEERRGFMDGDGTGVGKGLISAAIIADNWAHGRKKSVWFIPSDKLLNQVKFDLKAMGLDDKVIVANKIKPGSPIKVKEGILLMTYGRFTSTKKAKAGEPKPKTPYANYDSLVEWLGSDFDGPINFDESHLMKTAMAGSGRNKKVSIRATLGKKLQSDLPNARVTTLSATGATELMNLAYMTRLGLWGTGTAFPSVNEFIGTIGSSGTSAMEMVATDLKRQGSYIARSMSFDGIEYRQLKQTLTPEQETVYNEAADAWLLVYENIGATLNTIAHGNAQAKKYALGQFYAAELRFFNGMITALKMPTMFQTIDDLLANGVEQTIKNADGTESKVYKPASVTIQMVSTDEAMADRAIARAKENTAEGEDDDLDAIDLSPLDILMQYVKDCYPTQRYEDYIDDNGDTHSRPVVDSLGNPVNDPEAESTRDALLEKLGAMGMPQSAINQLIDHYGEDKVAEVSGRSTRPMWKEVDGVLKRVAVPRNSMQANVAESAAYQSGKKLIAVITGAGLLGGNFDADRRVANQRVRCHLALQPGWSADQCIQGLGRSNRANQVQPPVYYLVSTTVPGEARFVSTIARRLDQLGAITKGSRKTASGGLFKALDNLETPYARNALSNLITEIATGADDAPMDEATFTRLSGLRIHNKDGTVSADRVEVPRFLNRVLAMPLDKQALIFNRFEELHKERLQAAADAGTLDVGMETLRAHSITKKTDIPVWTDPRTGAITRLVQLNLRHLALKRAFDQLGDSVHFGVNKKSGQIWAFQHVGASTDALTGAVIQRWKMFGPTSTQYHNGSAFDSSKFDFLKRPEAKKAWDEQLKNAPKWNDVETNLLVGTLLPIWDRLPVSDVRLYRAQTDTGERFLGRWIHPDNVDPLMRRLGVKQKPITADNALEAIGKRRTITLANGWQVKQSRVANDTRIEILGPTSAHFKELEDIGVFREMIQWKTRFFIPTDNANEVFAKLVKYHPIADAGGAAPPAGGTSGGSFPGVHGGKMPDHLAGARKMIEPGPADYVDGWTRVDTDPAPEDFAFPPPGAEPPARTAEGEKLVAQFHADPMGRHVGMRTIVSFLNDALHVQFLVGNAQLPGKYGGQYERGKHTIRSRTPSSVLDFHEAGHAVSGILTNEDVVIPESLEDALVALTQDVGSFASKKSMEEGFAEFIRRFVSGPELPAGLYRDIVSLLAHNVPKVLHALQDARAAYAAHIARKPEGQLASYTNDRLKTGSAIDKAKDFINSLLYNIVSARRAPDATFNRMYKALRDIDAAAARNWEKAITNTDADFRSAYQSLIRIPREVGRAIYGAEKGINGLRVLSTGGGDFTHFTKEGLALLEAAGFKIPKQVRHGEYLQITDKSFMDLVRAVGEKDWEVFEIYRQYKTAVERADLKSHPYPALTEGWTQQRVKEWLKQMEKEHPTWPAHMEDITDWFRQLMMIDYLSGELTEEALLKIADTYDFYTPLQRQIDERIERRSGGGVNPKGSTMHAHGSHRPFKTLLESAERMVKMSYDSLGFNRVLWAVYKAGEQIAKLKGMPEEVRTIGRQMMLRLHLDTKKMATLTEREQKVMIADYLNRAAQEELPEGEVSTAKPLTADDIGLDFPGKPIFRKIAPRAPNVVSGFANGERVYFQITDPWLFQMFAQTSEPMKWLNTLSQIGTKVIAPWKRAVTQTLVFALVRNPARDAASAIFTAQSLREWIPGYSIGFGLLNRLMGKRGNLDMIAEAEMLSKTLSSIHSKGHAGFWGHFVDMMGEGLWIDGWRDMSWPERIGKELPGQISSLIMKPVDIANWITGGRYASNLTESATREGKALERQRLGGSTEQMSQAYETGTGNWGMRQGNGSWQAFVRMAGFLNCALQWMYEESYRLFDDPDRKRRAVTWLRTIPWLMMLTGVAAAVNWLMTGEEDRKRIRELPDEDRLRNAPVFGIFRMPFDRGIKGSIMSLAWNKVQDWLSKEPVNSNKMAKALLANALDIPSPIDTLHPWLRTLIETKMIDPGGYSFYMQRPIVPPWMLTAYPLNPEKWDYPDTPDFYRALAKMRGSSPLLVRYAMRQLFSDQMDGLIRMGEALTKGKPLGIETLGDIPLVGRAFEGNPVAFHSKSVQELADLDRKYMVARQTLQSLLDRPNPTEDDRATYARVQQQLNDLATTHDNMKMVEEMWQEDKKLPRTPVNMEQIRHLEKLMVQAARDSLGKTQVKRRPS